MVAQTIVISAKKAEINLEQTLQNTIGKRVLGKNGEVIGKVKDLVISNQEIEGILVKTNKKKAFIQLEYIDQLFNDSVMLKIDPITRYFGMQVFDAEGRNLGKIVDVTRATKSNTIQKLIVKKGLFGKQKSIPASYVETAAKNIILKTAEE